MLQNRITFLETKMIFLFIGEMYFDGMSKKKVNTVPREYVCYVTLKNFGWLCAAGTGKPA